MQSAATHLAWCNSILAVSAQAQRAVSPASEWLLDNYYLLEGQVRTVREDLPADYGLELPRLTSGELAGNPRVYGAAVALVSHTDARLDEEFLLRFVMGFQDSSPLSIGEVWAVPIMLRVALIENVRRIADRVVRAQLDEYAADDWADRLLTSAQEAPDQVAGLLSRLDTEHPGAEAAFFRRLAQRLQGKEAVTADINEWLEGRVTSAGTSFELAVHAEQQEQAANQVSVANSITSIRLLEALDWRSFFERTCIVEHVLRQDPADVYHRMDFRSRDRLRHGLEELAKRCEFSEVEVAEAAVSWSLEAISRDPSDLVRGHVGHYLISRGRYVFEESIGYRPRLRERLYRGPLSHRGLIYWGGLGTVTVALVLSLGWYAIAMGLPAWAVALLLLLGVVPMSDLGINIANRFAAMLWPPRVFPKLDYRRPISDAHATLVVVPALLSSVKATSAVLENLERTYLANPDPNLRFGVLGDLKAADAAHAPGDPAIVEAALKGVDELNTRYEAEHGRRPFLAFVRERRFCESEQTWMGWERKRGALTELARYLRGATDTSFAHVAGERGPLADVTFVATLDADTILPRDGAAKLVSTIAHPLNRAVYDADLRRVTDGYALVQPRVGMSLPAAGRSFFAWLYSGVTGIDPYAGAVSDTYQDVFGEGSFTGKGIFEVDVFIAALEGRVPHDSLLSHDLLEGCYLRTALVSDVEVFDEHPSSYAPQCARVHRWVRGDWQTLPWLALRVPLDNGGSEPNPLSLLHRWKILDNLRRSLFAPATLLLAFAGWYLLPGSAWQWDIMLLTVLLFPAYFSLADSMLFRPQTVSFSSSFHTAWKDFGRDSARAFLSLTMLPHQAHLMLDAIIRALWRMTVTRRGLLEWETAADAEHRLGSDLGGFMARMWPAAAVAAALTAPALLAGPERLLTVLPFAAVWLVSPYVAWRISRPIDRSVPEPTEAERTFMRRTARRAWRFFDTFPGAEDHWLTPDNYQEEPKGEVAHRTSPTNVGIQLLAYLTAYDLGYTTCVDLLERVSRTVSTLAGMERFRGHFYNWYDTRTLQPLRPGYVSTVDSGNLAGHLLVLRVALLEASESPLLGPQLLDGLADTALLALEDLVAARDASDAKEAIEGLRDEIDGLRRRVSLEVTPANLGEWLALLNSLATLAEEIPLRLAELGDAPETDGPAPATPVERARASCSALLEAVRSPLRDVETLAPWVPLLAGAPPALRACSRYEDLCPLLEHTPSLVGLAEGLDRALDALTAIATDPPGEDPETCGAAAAWAEAVLAGVHNARPACVTTLAQLRLEVDIAREMWEHTDFRMLYDRSRQLFSIGFNTSEGRLDNSYYDMLASECRLASFLAVAKGDVPQDHWFRLGRPITRTDAGNALVSWSASMFEYLMPLLVMRSWRETLLDETYGTVVRRQIQYGRQRGVPWGVSESAFNAKDADLTYQYQAFGVPGLGLKRGLSGDVVVAPYATLLALQVDRAASIANLDALRKRGAEGWFGFYEAVDYTPGRVPAGKERAIVRAYFAHHHGMGMVALGGELTGHRMRMRFHADPMVRSAELLLQERVPRHVQLATPHVEEVRFVRSVRELPAPVARSYPLADTPTPATHFLSNGRYSVMVTNAGGGYSRWEDLAVTRYREDITRDCWGTFFFVRDVDEDRVWSAAHQPSLATADDYHVTFSEARAEWWRTDGEIDTHYEVVVSPEDDVEVRRITFTNHSRVERRLEVTSYLEVAMAPQGADQAHKGFSNLFVETHADEPRRALLFSRRPRSAEEARPWGFHVLACESDGECPSSYETDRARFLGRLRDVHAPAALDAAAELSGISGAVLDPVCAIRHALSVGPGATARIVFSTGVARERDEAARLVEKYGDIRSAQRAADLAWTAGQVELRDLGISAEDAVTFQRLASRLLLTDPHSPLKVKTAVENGLKMDGLWSLGISGDLPILLVRIERVEETPLVRQALLAHQYWRHRGLVADLVVLNTRPTGYADELADRLRLLVRTGHALQLQDRPGGVFLRRADQMHPDVLNLLLSVARATLTGDGGPIVLQLNQRGKRPAPPDPLVPRAEPGGWPAPVPERLALEFDNGFGGFDVARGEYVTRLAEGETTPAPWINVIAGPRFGTLVSEAGIGCTWAENSHENRITTWNNDPVTDGSGETTYIRDEETGEYWSPTPAPARAEGTYVARHGRGYSIFEHTSHGIVQELTWFVPPQDPVRIARLRLTNATAGARSLSVTHMVEWVLGSSRSRANQQVVTCYDPEARILTAHNHFNPDFPGRPAFLACDRETCGFTGSRTEFIGRNGCPAHPAAMGRKGLGGVTGRFHDNCGALMVRVDLAPGESTEISFMLGQTAELAEARELVARYRRAGAVEEALASAKAAWADVLDAVEIATPDAALDRLVNGMLLYQVLSCRLWGRTATYQSSGAFGFRDQLQDSLAALHVRPDLVRAHIVECARRQFPEGDVLHWWQPESGRGVRTRFTDDRNWLPFVVAEYVRATGDLSVLDETTAYLDAQPLAEGVEDLYVQPGYSQLSGTVYEHCCAALDASLGVGPHGLPLIGGGDWNDGMNRVGLGGSGESVWLAWFLDVTMRSFAEVCERRGDAARAAAYRATAARFVQAVEREAWDGAWYRRAFFDDGTPLGTRASDECSIDAIAQAWAVISGSGDRQRAMRSLEAVEQRLVRWDDSLIMLLAPPFDRMSHDPGYIKGYVPGVRENGGQYTHAAVWVALAYLLTGDGDEALALLDLINPINHALTPEAVGVYKVEPYVVAADVYAVGPHVGRGGWTWYTGSASWFYRVVVRWLLGLDIIAEEEHRHLVVDPCIPKSWGGYSMRYRADGTTYEIEVENPRGVNRGVAYVELDGVRLPEPRVPLERDAGTRRVRVVLLGG
ncbi:MAG: hypothetical protein C0418_00200 [Coriobacteriaceae bacterium]|nr:hypothetical protein [Coriobacteriaceae bacterium]